MKRIFKIVDFITDSSGKLTSFLVIILVSVMSFEVTMRYVFNNPTSWAYETSTMLGCTIFVVGWSYAHRHHYHVRVDVLYTHLPLRTQMLIDVIGTLIFFIPLITIFIKVSISYAWEAWITHEVMIVGIWYPPTAPIRTVVVLAACLFALQGMVQFIRDSYMLVKGQPYD